MNKKSNDIKKYDAIIIGSGQAGNPLMHDLASRGQRVAMIEKNMLGGSCINFGCTPTKTLIASSNIYHRVKTSSELGVNIDNVSLDFKKVMDRKNDIVRAFRGTVEKKTKNNENVDLYRGVGSFIDKNTISIKLNDGEEKIISGDMIYINSGSESNKIDLDGLDQVKSYDSTTIMEIDALPEHLVIIGTGYIALEFGQMFKRFGSRVTIVGRDDKILKREDEDVSMRMQEILEDEGIEFKLNADTKGVEKDGDNVNIYIKQDNDEDKLVASHLMLAVGRVPVTDSLNLKSAGVDVDEHGNVKVDEHLKTTSDNIYALGDVKGGPQFTHMAYDDYRIVVDQLFGEKKRNTNDRLVPYTLYTEPQLGRVGLSEKEAKDKGYDVKIGKIEMSKQGRPIEENYTKGFMKAVVNKEDGKILGTSILGYQGGEIMAMIEIAMMSGMTYDKLRDGIFSHPSLSEILNNLFDI